MNITIHARNLRGFRDDVGVQLNIDEWAIGLTPEDVRLLLQEIADDMQLRMTHARVIGRRRQAQTGATGTPPLTDDDIRRLANQHLRPQARDPQWADPLRFEAVATDRPIRPTLAEFGAEIFRARPWRDPLAQRPSAGRTSHAGW